MPNKSPTGRYEKQLQRQLEYETLLDKRWEDMSPQERQQFPELQPGIDPTYLREVYGRQPVQPQTITGDKAMFTDAMMMEFYGPQSRPGAPTPLGMPVKKVDGEYEFDRPDAFSPREDLIELQESVDYLPRKTPHLFKMNPYHGGWSDPKWVDPEWGHYTGGVKQGEGDPYDPYDSGVSSRSPYEIRGPKEMPATTIEEMERRAFDPSQAEPSPEMVFYSEMDPSGEHPERVGGYTPFREKKDFGTGLNRVGQALEMAWDSLSEGQIEQLKSAGGNEARADLMMDFYYGNLQNMSDQGVDVTPLMLKVDPRMGEITQEDLENRANYYYWKKFTEGGFPSARPMSQGSSRMIPM